MPKYYISTFLVWKNNVFRVVQTRVIPGFENIQHLTETSTECLDWTYVCVVIDVILSQIQNVNSCGNFCEYSRGNGFFPQWPIGRIVFDILLHYERKVYKLGRKWVLHFISPDSKRPSNRFMYIYDFGILSLFHLWTWLHSAYQFSFVIPVDHVSPLCDFI